MNKLYQQLQTQKAVQNLSSSANPIKQMLNTLKMAQNPQALLNGMIGQNPQLKSVIDLVTSSGKSPKDLFYEMARQKGVDPEQVLKSLI